MVAEMVHWIEKSTAEAMLRKPIYPKQDTQGKRAFWNKQVDEIYQDIVALPFSCKEREAVDAVAPRIIAWSAHAVLSGHYHHQAIADATLLMILTHASNKTEKVVSTY